MLAKIRSAALIGIEAIPITVEIDSQQGLPTENIVGLGDTVIKESKVRIKSAIKNSHFKYPVKNITINLAPADFPKQGSYFDLPIAVGILQASEQLPPNDTDLFIGELSLSGDIKGIKGIISICHMAQQKGISRVFLPKENLKEAQLIENIQLIPLSHLTDLLNDWSEIPFNKVILPKSKTEKKAPDFSDVKGQLATKRALEIAATGKHNILLIGPPGSGKSMLIKRFAYIFPELSLEEAIETYKLSSILTQSFETLDLSFTPPFRAPHHSISYAGMSGGGKKVSPGEISMAHNGILFLDEFPEFSKTILEGLRQPLENKTITISRANLSITYPCDFILAGAMNPCPCGYSGDTQKKCSCHPNTVKKYLKKCSGPMLDRFDIIIEVPRLKKSDFVENSKTLETNANIKERVLKHRKKQEDRHQEKIYNGQLSPKEIKTYCHCNESALDVLHMAIDKGILTGRSYDKTLKVARSIADINESDKITETEILEALQYRKSPLDDLFI